MKKHPKKSMSWYKKLANCVRLWNPFKVTGSFIYKKKYIIAFFTFIVIAVLFPFLLELIYSIGDIYPIFVTHYSQSDVLTYSVTVAGLMISIWAVFLAKSTTETHIQVSHGATVNNDNKVAVCIEVINNSVFDCKIANFSLINKKKDFRISLINHTAFTVKAQDCEDIIIDISKLMNYVGIINQYNSDSSRKNRKLFYEIRLSNNEEIILNTGDLDKYLEEEKNEQA